MTILTDEDSPFKAADEHVEELHEWLMRYANEWFNRRLNTLGIGVPERLPLQAYTRDYGLYGRFHLNRYADLALSKIRGAGYNKGIKHPVLADFVYGHGEAMLIAALWKYLEDGADDATLAPDTYACAVKKWLKAFTAPDVGGTW